MKILVTGGAGYVGSTLVPMLLSAGHKVRVLDNLMYGGEGLIPCFRNPNFEFMEGDICDKPTLIHAIWGCDLVIHLAAIVGFPACRRDPNLAHSVNYLGTRNVAHVAGRSLPIIFASTGSNYGAVDGVCTEETPLKPLSLYGRTKVAAEQCLLEECETVIYRFSTGFGLSPRMRLDLLINDFVRQVITEHYLVVYEAHFMRTFIHVVDMARAFLFAVDGLDHMLGEVYNVTASSKYVNSSSNK
jgi:nucleoside-diphosphate-sugar epimerase